MLERGITSAHLVIKTLIRFPDSFIQLWIATVCLLSRTQKQRKWSWENGTVGGCKADVLGKNKLRNSRSYPQVGRVDSSVSQW